MAASVPVITRDDVKTDDHGYDRLPGSQIDQETGFIWFPSQPDHFDPHRKLQFIQVLRSNGFRHLAACETVGINYRTYCNHYRIDPIFREQMQLAKMATKETVENVLYQCALDPRKTIDRLAFLRKIAPEEYNPTMRHESTQTIVFDASGLTDFYNQKRVDNHKVVDVSPLGTRECQLSGNTSSESQELSENSQ